MTAQQAVKKYVNNSDMVFVGGFGHAIPFSIAQEIVRQKKTWSALDKNWC